MGGMHGFGQVLTPGSDEPYHERWEPRVFAISTLTAVEDLGQGSGRAIREEMEPAHYLAASYYERWLWSTERRLERRGTIAPGEVDAWVERLRRGEAVPHRRDAVQVSRVLEAVTHTTGLGRAGENGFQPGDHVRVKRMRPEGHTRCPRYVRGAEGVVEGIRGTDALPDVGPYEGPEEAVYSVRFASEDLFGPGGEAPWTVLLDLFESYLERP
jgi:nitrile hydratase